MLAVAAQNPSCVLSQRRVAARVTTLAREVDDRFGGRRPLLIGVLTGAYVFLADLSRQLRTPHDIAFVRAGSYRDGPVPAPDVAVDGLGTLPVRGRDVLLVEDVLDTGHTLDVLLAALRDCGARSVTSCVLVVKDRPRPYPIVPDMAGFVVPPVFVVGYGIDYRGAWRHLPYIGCVDPEPGEPCTDQAPPE